MSSVSDFVHHNYRHFNAAAMIDAADAHKRHLVPGWEDATIVAPRIFACVFGL